MEGRALNLKIENDRLKGILKTQTHAGNIRGGFILYQGCFCLYLFTVQSSCAFLQGRVYASLFDNTSLAFLNADKEKIIG